MSQEQQEKNKEKVELAKQELDKTKLKTKLKDNFKIFKNLFDY